MRYAVCSNDPAVIADSREAGFDYVEASVPNLVRPSDPEEAFEETLASYRAAGLPIESANLFLPRELRCTGPDAVPMERLAEYADTVCRRLAAAGVPILVFGSGGARKLPEGWPKEKADGQFVALLSRIGPIAGRHGVKIAVEPLARVECNYLNTVDEGAALARASGSPAVGVLADCYHWARNEETAETILAAKGVLLHAHLATLPGRKAPGVEPYDFVPFFRALAAAGYDGRVSIEGGLPPPEGRVDGLRRALDVLRAAHEAALRG
jgi:sugar phosphate isomerase/epimerase